MALLSSLHHRNIWWLPRPLSTQSLTSLDLEYGQHSPSSSYAKLHTSSSLSAAKPCSFGSPRSKGMATASAGCWTCKDRKIRCDRTLPACTNCTRSMRICQGYGLRLSWPRRESEGRSLKGPSPPVTTGGKRICESRWINASFWDIELQQHLTVMPWSQGITDDPTRPVLRSTISWAPSRLSATENDLFQYFVTVALQNLTTCDSDDQRFAANISRLALTDGTDSSMAVLQSLLAVASLHRYGLQADTVKLQTTALTLLQNSAHPDLSYAEAIRHIAAGMLLCSFEIQADTQTSGPWIWYVSGAKRLLNIVNPRQENPAAELKAMLNWVYYHDVIAQFSLRHWHRPAENFSQLEFHNLLGPTNHDLLQVPGISTCGTKVLTPLSEVFENIVRPVNPRYHDPQYRSYLATLEQRLEAIDSTRSYIDASQSSDDSDVDVNLELYRLAALVYLERASKNFSGQSSKLDGWTDSALRLIQRHSFCKQGFPLFIFGCEARTDTRRIIILDAIDRTIKASHSRSVQLLHKILQTVWNQDDLEAESDLDYVTKMDTILSSCDRVPSFA